jgi:hypothetical protein
VVLGPGAPRPDAGTTTAFAALVAFLLGALAWHHPSLAVGLGVIVLVLLAVKYPMQEFAERMIDERDITNFCVLLAIAFLVLPLLPDRDVGPYGALNPATIGRLIPRAEPDRVGRIRGHPNPRSTVGAVDRRLRGRFRVGRRDHRGHGPHSPAAPRFARPPAAALVTNISTIVLAVAITRVVNVEVSSRLALVFGGAAMMIAAETAFLLLRRRGRTPRAVMARSSICRPGCWTGRSPSRRPSRWQEYCSLLLVVTRGAVDVFGGGGAVAAAAGGLADAHSAALSAASATGESLSVDAATMAATAAVGTNLLLTLAAIAGSVSFALRLAAWLAPPVAITVVTMWALLIR